MYQLVKIKRNKYKITTELLLLEGELCLTIRNNYPSFCETWIFSLFLFAITYLSIPLNMT